MQLTNRARPIHRVSLTESGLALEPLKGCFIYAGHGYYFGASSSPSFVIVLSVTPESVTYCDAHGLETRREQRCIFEDLAVRAGETMREHARRAKASAEGADTSKAMGRLAVQIARVTSERAADHGAPVVFADHDRVRFTVTADGDAYSADRFGVLSNFDSEKNVATIEAPRSVRAILEAEGFRVLNVETVKSCPRA